MELNVYFVPTDTDLPGEAVEEMYANVVADVKSQVSIPVAVKISPYFSSLAYTARYLVRSGANGLVLFNRFYQPDFDIEALEVVPRLVLSDSNELRLPLRWIAILYGRVMADLALTTGVHTAEDALKFLIVGASLIQVGTALFIDPGAGIPIASGIMEYMEHHGMASMNELIGSLDTSLQPSLVAAGW